MNQKLLYTGIVSLVVALGGFLMGFDAGVISGANPLYKDYFFLSDWALGWSVACLTFGAMFGNLLAGPLADRFGRKSVLILAAFLFSVSAVSSAMATDFRFFIFARMLGGVAVGLALLIAPVYIAEISPPKLRGRFVSFNQLNIVIGFSAVFFSNYYILKMAETEAIEVITKPNCWRWMLGAETVPAIFYFCFLFFVPRSPRWLAKRGRYDEALSVLNKFVSPEEATQSLAEIKEHFQDDSDKQRYLTELFRSLAELFTHRMSYILFIALGLGFFQQITGINAIFFYAPTIFEKTGIPQEDAFLQTIIIGLVNLGFTIFAIYFIDRFGRKPLLLVGTSAMAICLFTTSWAFNTATYQLTTEMLDEFKDSMPEEVVNKLIPLAGRSYDSEDMFVAQAAALMESVVRGQSDFESALSAELKSAADELDAAAFATPGSFESAMKAAVGPRTFVAQFPASGKDALRALKKKTFTSRDEFMQAINDFIDGTTLDGYVDSVANKGLSINARLVLMAIIGYIAAFAISLGPVMWAMFSEIFPNRLRGIAISVAGVFNSLVSLTVQQVFPWELSAIGPAATFLIFGLFAALAFLFTAKYIPETKGKSLEQLEEELVITT